jgi:molybdopterin converting factor small subunit
VFGRRIEDRTEFYCSPGENVKITLAGTGPLRQYLGGGTEVVRLPDDSVLADLFQWIEEHHASELPDYLWDFRSHKFRGPVIFAIDGRQVLDTNTPLTDGAEVTVMYAVAGGRA